MALPLGEDRDEHVRPRHLFAARALDVDHRPLDHPVEAGRRLGVLLMPGDEVGEFGVDVTDQILAEQVEIDTAAASPQFFSITHCSGCWCWRAKSMTCVTFVSATSKVKTPHSPTP